MLIAKRVIGTFAYLSGVMSVPEPFCWSWGQMVQFSNEFLCEPGEMIHLERVDTSYHSLARNTLVDRFLGEWLLMLDADHTFEPDLGARLVALMDKHDLNVLTGTYAYKNPPHLPLLYWWDEGTKGFQVIADWHPDVKLIEVSCAGAGCLLVRRRVFDRIKAELHVNPFDVDHPLSEDFSFFKRLRKLGIKAHAAPQIESYHLRLQPISVSDRILDGVDLRPTEPQPVMAAA